jgi:WD40 repeat protein
LFEIKDHQKAVTDVDCSADGEWVVTASEDGTAIVRSVETGKPRYVFREHGGWVDHARFTRDSKHVVSVALGGDTRIWPADGAGESIFINSGRTGSLTGEPDSDENGRRILSISDGTVFVSSIDWHALVDRLRARTRQCLSPEQRARFLGEAAATAQERSERCQREH